MTPVTADLRWRRSVGGCGKNSGRARRRPEATQQERRMETRPGNGNTTRENDRVSPTETRRKHDRISPTETRRKHDRVNPRETRPDKPDRNPTETRLDKPNGNPKGRTAWGDGVTPRTGRGERSKATVSCLYYRLCNTS